MRPRGRLEGPPLVGLAALAVASLVAGVLAIHGTGAAAIGPGLRATARLSLALFLAAFVASSWVALRPSPASKWLLRNRRYVGLSMAVSHLAHAGFIAALAVHEGAAFWRRGIGLAGGLVGYLFLAAMAATSTDAARARLGAARWRLLHRAGMYVLWGVFALTYGGFAHREVVAAIATAALAAALGLRLAVRVRAGGRPRRPAVAG